MGATRSLLYNLTRKSTVHLPNEFAELFSDCGLLDCGKSMKLVSELGCQNLLKFLIDEEYLFKCTLREAKFFPMLTRQWDFPCKITNCIIDISSSKYFPYFERVASSLNDLYCNALQLRFFDLISLDKIEDCVSIFTKKRILNIELILKFDHSDLSFLNRIIFLLENYFEINMIIAHSAPQVKEIQISKGSTGKLLLIQETLTSASHCGLIHPGYFTINVEMFTESHNYNTCLNRKISIDVNGEIKNCPSMAKSYGNIKDTKLIDVVNNPEFQKVWHIKKDEITKCKDCEFRHTCTDCRAYLENPEDQYSAPLKCGYNPYTCEWEEWSTNPLKQQAITYYGMQELK